MLSLLVYLSKVDESHGITYYQVGKQWSDGEYSFTDKGFSDLQDMFEYTLGDISVYHLNRITFHVVNDQELKAKLNIALGNITDSKLSRTKLFKQEFNDEKKRKLYKHLIDTHNFLVL